MFCAKCVVSTGGFNAHGLPQLRGKIAFLVRISMLGGRMSSFLEHNRQAWDERMRRRDSHTESAADSDFRDPLAAADSLGWLGGNVQGRRILCLAAGGGKHGALFAAAGADVTVVDLSPAMLERDRAVAIQRGLKLRTVEASMTDLSMLAEGSFDAVVQPVSSCYVPDVIAVYREVARVTAPEGLYISQHKQPSCLQAEALPSGRGYLLSEPYYRSGPLPPVLPGLQYREAGTVEFLHRWEELLGGLCRSGFVVEDLLEPKHGDGRAEPGTFAHRCHFMPPFVTLKARRIGRVERSGSAPRLWLPS
jgi:SAM-dependent methyltransferase